MRTKHILVQTEFHPRLTGLLLLLNRQYITWRSELVITSGSELDEPHSRTSLHYAGCAVDIRSRRTGKMPWPTFQLVALRQIIDEYCSLVGIPNDWFDLVLEKNHLHLEYQPKRIN